MKPSSLPSCPPLRPISDSRVSKRRRDAQKSVPTRQRSISSSAHCPGNGFSEEKLFELLIGKIKQREESEVATAKERCHLEEQNALLTEKNTELRGQLEACRGDFQKAISEAETRKSRMNTWKAKLQKFKGVVNVLGHEYDCLRSEANGMKESASLLAREKDDLAEALDGIKIQIARAEETIEEQRNQIVANDGTIAALRQAVEASQDQLRGAKTSLADEKKRGAALESYIKTCAMEQQRQLALMKADHPKLLKRVDSMSAILAEEIASSKDKILSEARASMEEMQTSMETLSEKSRVERITIQEFSNAAHDIAAR